MVACVMVHILQRTEAEHCMYVYMYACMYVYVWRGGGGEGVAASPP